MNHSDHFVNGFERFTEKKWLKISNKLNMYGLTNSW